MVTVHADNKSVIQGSARRPGLNYTMVVSTKLTVHEVQSTKSMSKRASSEELTSTIFGAAIFAGASFAAFAAPHSGKAPSAPSWWLHPKLGMVKVDRVMKAMVHAKRTTESAKQAELGLHSH